MPVLPTFLSFTFINCHMDTEAHAYHIYLIFFFFEVFVKFVNLY